MVRCSVVFDSVGDLLAGFNQLWSKYSCSTDTMTHKDGCIQAIVRVKNDFSDIEDECWNINVDLFHYCDVKCNVLIEYNNVRIIGEIQLLLSSMLNAKKKGHSIYSFQRRAPFYNQLAKLIHCDSDENLNQFISSQLQSMIFSRNTQKLSFFMQTLTKVEKEYLLKNEKQVCQLFNQNGWKRGANLFQLTIVKCK